MSNKTLQSMKSSVSNKNNPSNNVKSKKTIKDREKRRSLVGTDKAELHSNNEKGSPSKVC